MRTLLYILLALFLATAKIALADEPRKQDAGTDKGGMATLYALDPLAHCYSFDKAKYGGEIVEGVHVQGGVIADIDFGVRRANAFTIGFDGGHRGKIVDLGTADQLQEKYGYREIAGNGQGYASIHKKGSEVLIASSQYPTGQALEFSPLNEKMFQPLRESKELFEKGGRQPSAAVNLGHIYVLRISDSKKEDFERVVKLKVIEFRPGESVTIRWQLLK